MARFLHKRLLALNIRISDFQIATEGVGSYHRAILYPTRKDLAIIFDRLRRAYYPLTSASDQGVSEELYLNDPDGNGVELYGTDLRNIGQLKTRVLYIYFKSPTWMIY